MSKFLVCFLLFLSTGALDAGAQFNKRLPLDTLPLHTLDLFQQPSKEWKLVSNVTIDRKENVLKTSAGTGVLLFSGTGKQELYMKPQHGNLDLAIDFMLTKDAAASIILQGLYELVLNDSWGEQGVSSKTGGGIRMYKQDTAVLRFGRGNVAPLHNAIKAPGLWQKLQISFHSPQFNDKGQKIRNAGLMQVILNGITIHENIELTPEATITEPTVGGLLLNVNKGPVAFRNIAMLQMKNDSLKVKDVKYKYFEAKLKDFPDFAAVKLQKQGKLDDISWQPATNNDGFAFEYTGTLHIPAANLYHFELISLGGGQLFIDGRKVIEHVGEIDHEGKMSRKDLGDSTLHLAEGEHPFRLVYYKNSWAPVPVLGWFVQGRGNYRQALHASDSYSDEEPVSRILLRPAQEPVIQRSFIRFKGVRKTHCISVGDPAGTHYTYDLSNGALMQVWKGNFADATHMWHDRGTQILETPGAPLLFNDRPQFAKLVNNGLWPDSSSAGEAYTYKGYELDQHGRPIFHYNIAGVDVREAIYPMHGGRSLSRKILVTSKDNTETYFRIAEARSIEKRSDGEYSVNDNEYFIEVQQAEGVSLRSFNGKSELIVPLKKAATQAVINYSLIW